MINLNYETLFNYFMYKNKKIFCQIKVKPTKSGKIKSTCRALTPEQWNIFDKKLEEVIDKTVDWNRETSQRFNINPNIEVKVQKSKLSLKHFNIFLGALAVCNNDESGVEETNFIIECIFNFKQKSFNVNMDSQEYIPQVESSPQAKIDNIQPYEPYTPSKKGDLTNDHDENKTSSTDLLDINEDTYSPKPLFEITEINPFISENIPKYTPAPIKIFNTENIKETKGEVQISSHKYKSSRRKVHQNLESEYIPKSEQLPIVDVPVYIPTPIEEVKENQNLLESDTNIRKYKRRSKTIDEYPSQVYENSYDFYSPLKQPLESKDTTNLYKKKISIKRSKTIDEIPTAFAIYNENSILSNDINFEKDINNSCEKLRYSNKSNLKALNENVSTIKNNTKPSSLSKENEVLLASLCKKSSKNNKPNESTRDEIKKEKNTVQKNGTDINSLRRSERSSSKPIRFIEEQPSLLKKLKITPKNRELFGTDDEDDDESFDHENSNKTNENADKIKPSTLFKTPGNEKYSKNNNSFSSLKKKRKREKTNECVQEKRDINKWLSKKKYASSAAELELRNKSRLEQKENKIMQINKNEIFTSKPEEVNCRE
ncbi:uncharacterized protein ACRADG_000587 [Cochliomyia hominivorax]